jgi:hypothetical protein
MDHDGPFYQPVSFQPSAISSQLSALSYQLAAINHAALQSPIRGKPMAES